MGLSPIKLGGTLTTQVLSSCPLPRGAKLTGSLQSVCCA